MNLIFAHYALLPQNKNILFTLKITLIIKTIHINKLK